MSIEIAPARCRLGKFSKDHQPTQVIEIRICDHGIINRGDLVEQLSASEIILLKDFRERQSFKPFYMNMRKEIIPCPRVPTCEFGLPLPHKPGQGTPKADGSGKIVIIRGIPHPGHHFCSLLLRNTPEMQGRKPPFDLKTVDDLFPCEHAPPSGIQFYFTLAVEKGKS